MIRQIKSYCVECKIEFLSPIDDSCNCSEPLATICISCINKTKEDEAEADEHEDEINRRANYTEFYHRD